MHVTYDMLSEVWQYTNTGCTLLLIDRRGQRVRPVCRECRALHKPENCPKLKRERKARKRRIAALLAFQAQIMAFRGRTA